jgi:hypothetical protein
MFVSFRNGHNVEGSTHKQVVDLIKSGGDVLKLVVLSVTSQVRNYVIMSITSLRVVLKRWGTISISYVISNLAPLSL